MNETFYFISFCFIHCFLLLLIVIMKSSSYFDLSIFFQVCNPNYDYLQIKAGKLNERYCGSIDTPRTIESESNEMTIEFNSDNSVAGKGFKATYTHSKLFDHFRANLFNPSSSVISKQAYCECLSYREANMLFVGIICRQSFATSAVLC